MRMYAMESPEVADVLQHNRDMLDVPHRQALRRQIVLDPFVGKPSLRGDRTLPAVRMAATGRKKPPLLRNVGETQNYRVARLAGLDRNVPGQEHQRTASYGLRIKPSGWKVLVVEGARGGALRE